MDAGLGRLSLSDASLSELMPQPSSGELFGRWEAWRGKHAWHELPAVERVWAASDMHVEASANRAWIEQLEPRLTDALIVAGDMCTSEAKLVEALTTLTSKSVGTDGL